MGREVVAFVTLDDNVADAFDEDALKEFVKDRKGSVQTPKSVLIIGALLVTKIGKPDKVALQGVAIERAAT